ncbi:MAG: hypothetical protein QOF84_1669, partial [Streptomyces sp.]|nr:hypothetical protein [Streptomyces sp.]
LVRLGRRQLFPAGSQAIVALSPALGLWLVGKSIYQLVS